MTSSIFNSSCSYVSKESVNSTQNQDLSAKEIRPFDVSSPDAAGLKGTDDLICTTGYGGLDLQPKLAEVGNSVGVKLFVPAEFGDTTDGASIPLLKLKHRSAPAWPSLTSRQSHSSMAFGPNG
jgi:hypothetical protein